MSNDKVIVTNYKAMRAKYGAEGVARIKAAVDKLIVRDKKDALKTVVIDISNSVQMARVKGTVVTDPMNQRSVKSAIDAAWKAIKPAYLMILGSNDVVPHQDLTNPIADPNEGDPDELVPTDLPYACDAAYSNDPTRFIGPTRVVGRLPDMNAATRPDYLLRVLRFAANRTSRPPAEYRAHFGISAADWNGSTRLSMQKIFGDAAVTHTSPERGPEWRNGELGARAHFINCHGNIKSPAFRGQSGESYPVAHHTRYLDGCLTEGTVAAVECCYGAELYDPVLAGNLMGICHAYLCHGASGYCGSSTIAYGPADENGQADLICQYFLKSVLGGASVGRAMLEARQEFARKPALLDPVDLKTLIQFNLMGDPSVHPVAKASGTKLVGRKASLSAAASPRAVNRAERRTVLERTGSIISLSQFVARPFQVAVASARLKLRRLAHDSGINKPSVLSFRIEPAAAGASGRKLARPGFASASPEVETLHVLAERQRGADEHDVRLKLLVVRETKGEVSRVREVVSR